MGAAGLFIFGIGVILLICYPSAKKKNSRCSAQTQGRLLKIFDTDSAGGNVGHAYLYSYFVNGMEYQFTSTAVNSQVNNEGDSCTIWYNPENPKEAQEFHSDTNKTYKLILIFGIVLVILGIIVGCLGFVKNVIQPDLVNNTTNAMFLLIK